jgi:hypothetical protein
VTDPDSLQSAIRATVDKFGRRTTPRSTRRSMNFGGQSSSIFTARFWDAGSASQN